MWSKCMMSMHECSLISLTMIQKSCYVLSIIFSGRLAHEHPRNRFPFRRTWCEEKHNENDKAHKHISFQQKLLCSSFTVINEVILSFPPTLWSTSATSNRKTAFSLAANESAAEAGRESAHTCQRCRKALITVVRSVYKASCKYFLESNK